MSQKRLQKLQQVYPSVSDLQRRARKRMPHVAWEYLTSGTGEEEAVGRNLEGLAAITMVPQLLKGELQPDVSTTLFGRSLGAPFGVAPIGLAGLMWPRVEHILAATAAKYNIPYCLSTVATQTPETVGPIAGNMGWFQLYPPREDTVRRDLLQRVRDAGFTTLAVTVDTPLPSRRERTMRAGLRMPPKITPRFVWEALIHPTWTLQTLRAGLPRLRILEPYAKSQKMAETAAFVGREIGGTLSWDYLRAVRDQWQGALVLKGVHHPRDAEQAVAVGVDGVQVSNHGARQFDGSPAAIDLLPPIVRQVQGRASILFDSGIRSGLDIVRALALGADFVFLGRAFIFGVAALGELGGDHVVEILLEDLKINMAQLGYANLAEIERVE
ncbi:MAG: alpha-hydroxy-acid oxidizing protein [Candidatus Latescibacteria bacterium]|nr:alpha-hydroxy-acid oxidizing protein [Candidatus Latescibacterota bacterium]